MNPRDVLCILIIDIKIFDKKIERMKKAFMVKTKTEKGINKLK